jgi:nucleoside-diphosphate-sugar epimerase
MGKHVIVGSGAVGTAAALALVEAGHEVTVVTRSGSGPDHPGITRVATDASDPFALVAAVGDADALYNCANPPYHRWPELWPPMAASMLEVASRSDAVLVIMGNLYGYGPVDHPMTEDGPLASTGTKGQVRTAMWEDALVAHRSGRVRVTEARASDFFGPGGVDTSFFGRNVDRLLAGKKVRVLGDPDMPHSATYIPDVGRTLAVLGTDERAWGRAWHVPTGPALTQRMLATRFCEVAGAPVASVAAFPAGALAMAGVFSPQIRELKETRYQFDRPFVLDSSACTVTFGIEPTPLDEALAAVAEHARRRSLARSA